MTGFLRGRFSSSGGERVNKTGEQNLEHFVHRATPDKPFIYKLSS
jgi:hypothetical protein